MENKTHNKMLQGTWIMAFSAVFSKILSAIYRIPLQNMVGDHGYYVYQQVYSIYGIFAVLSLTGLPLLISKIFTDNSELELKKNINYVFWTLLIGVIFLVVIIEIFAGNIAQIMGDKNLTGELRAATLVFLLVPIEATVRGYYQAKLKVEVSALSQMLEQIIRVSLILIVAVLFTRSFMNVYLMGTMANFSAVVAAIISSIYLFFKFKKDINMPFDKPAIESKIVKRFLTEGTGIVLVTAILVVFQLIDSLTIVNELMASGMSLNSAGTLKGIFDRAQPLAQLGIVVVVSFLTVLVPIKESKTVNNKSMVKMLQLCVSLSMAETVVLVMLIRPINTLLFKNDLGSGPIGVFLLSVILYSVINLLVSLNNKNHRVVIYSIIISLIIKVILNKLLISKIKLYGASLATIVSLFVLMIILFFITDKDIRKAFRANLFLAKTLIITFLMTVSVQLTNSLTFNFFEMTRSKSLLIVTIGAMVALFVYLTFAIKSEIFTKNDMRKIPILKRIIK